MLEMLVFNWNINFIFLPTNAAWPTDPVHSAFSIPASAVYLLFLIYNTKAHILQVFE